MSEPESERSIFVTAEERTHPALRKLARACLALARHFHESPTSTPTIDADRSSSDAETKQ
jgi:hypothetical protein